VEYLKSGKPIYRCPYNYLHIYLDEDLFTKHKEECSFKATSFDPKLLEETIADIRMRKERGEEEVSRWGDTQMIEVKECAGWTEEELKDSTW